MNIVLITSSHLRHRCFVKSMCGVMPVSLVIVENKPQNNEGLKQREKEYFSSLQGWQPPCAMWHLGKGEINERYVARELSSLEPDFIFTFGCSLLKPRIFSIPKNGCINIHTGLVQKFRGVDSSFWALNKEVPEAIGATIHYINKGIDSGNIIFQTRPELNVEDTLEDVFLKTCLDSFEDLAKNSARILSGDVKGLPLKTKGELYQSRDMNDFVHEKTKNNLTNVLKSYILNKEERDGKIPLISCWT